MMNRQTTPDDSGPPPACWDAPPVALFWDQSLVWGLICRQTLQALGVPFHLLSGADIAGGMLERYRLLLVPGGWAAHKIRVLGGAGRREIDRFITRGGSYLGFCGGAGMALSSPPSLELVPFERMPLAERLPNASGEIHMRGVPGHPAWQGLPEEIPVSIWWPSQFAWQPLPRSLPLGFYTRPGKDFWVADLPFADFAHHPGNWEDFEELYAINLDPQRLLGQPAILEVRKGKGRLVLSYPHLETPGKAWANRMLLNVLRHLDDQASRHLCGSGAPECPPAHIDRPPTEAAVELIEKTEKTVAGLIAFGQRHLLWHWRLPWLLRWQRGIRGLEYGMLAVTVRSVLELGSRLAASPSGPDPWLEPVRKLEQDVREFCRQARTLLLEEKLAGHAGGVSKLGRVNERVDALRAVLFGQRMNHGGLCRAIFDDLDRLLLPLLRQMDARL